MPKRKSQLSPQILEEATEWFIDFNEGQVDQAGNEEFNAWLRRSPEHVQAFLQISAFWEDAGTLAKRPGLDIAEVVARAKAQSNVFALETAPRADAGVPVARTRKFRASLASAAVLLLAIGASLFVWHSSFRYPTYVTEIGEQRTITLEDGSLVELNSRSRIKLRFTEAERNVDLIEGQALFKVAKDATRPFIVSSGSARVRAVGTQFDVYRKTAGTVVTVVEGRVAVASSSTQAGEEGVASRTNDRQAKKELQVAPEELLLVAGEQVVVHPTVIEAPKPARVAVATAWTDQKLIFESTPLHEAVEEFNRYNRQQLVIRDPELYDFHVSGEFPSTDSSRMVEFLRQRFGVTLRRSGDVVEISAKSGG